MGKLIESGSRGVKNKAKLFLSITLPVTLVLNFVLLFVLFSNSPTRAGSSIEEPSLTCEQIGDVGTWSKKRYGGAKEVDLRTPKFAKKVAQVYVEKIDGYRLLFKKGEVENFRNAAVEAWSKVVTSKDCAYFETWVALQFARAKGDFDRRLRAIPLKFEPSQKADDSVAANLKSNRPKEFAKDEAELRHRLATFVTKIGNASHKKTLLAYGNDKREFIVDSLNQLLFEEPVIALNLLAKAMLGAIDPYSTYFSPSEFEDFYHELAGGTSGVGLKVRKVPQGLMVEKVLADSPAGRSKKVSAGDIIVAIDGASVKGVTVKGAKSMLKGQEATTIVMTIQKDVDGKKVQTISLKRETFSFEDGKISYRLETPKDRPGSQVAVIEIPSFYGRGGMDPMNEEHSSSEDLEKTIKKLMTLKSKPSAIVLDLRGNPGGFLEEAVAMAGLFLGSKPVVGVVERKDRRILKDHRKALYTGPLMVILDEGSASASEVLAGALKDHQRAVLVGAKSSYGKGSVQRLFHLSEELAANKKKAAPGVVKLTTSIFYSPLGHSPANGGVHPHIVLPTEKDASEEVDAERVAGSVPESIPFVDNEEVRRIRSDESLLKKDLMELENNDVPKLSQLIKWPTDLDKVAVNDDESSTKEDGERVVRSAVVLAASYAAMEQTKRSSTATNPHSALRNARRDVIGY